ncbi:MAG TPA: zf-HC2 domain-containing protein [Polyangiaceae bacterium]|jgi:anti-sigma factor RsiW
MTDCERARELIPNALRGRWSGADKSFFDEHLKTCAKCRSLLEREQALDQGLRAARFSAPEELKQKLASQLNQEQTTTHKGPVLARRTAFAAAGLLSAALVVGLLTVHALSPDERLVGEAINDHLRVLYAEHPLEVESGGIHQVKPWFTSRLDFAPAFAFSGDDEFALQGGAVSYFIDRKAAVFVFKYRLHTITLFVFRAENLPWSARGNTPIGELRGEAATERGFHTLLWRDADLGYALVSDAEAPTLARLAAKIASKN